MKADKMMIHILEHWDITYKHMTEIQKDVWSIDEAYFLKADNNRDVIRNIPIYEELRENGIPAPEVIRTIEGNYYLELDHKYYYMTCKLGGRHLSKEDVINNSVTARLIGQATAKLHKGFRVIMPKHNFKEMNLLQELNGWITENIKEYAPNSFTYGIIEECSWELERLLPDLPRQLIHRDLHLGNLLFNDNEITGYIDFDLSQINIRMFDIAYMMVGWIVDSVNDEEFTTSWKQAVQLILKGYQEELKLSGAEVEALPIIMCSIEILFVAYFESMRDRENVNKAEECLKWLWSNKREIRSYPI